MQSNSSKSRQQKICVVLKNERKYLVLLYSEKWSFPSTPLYDKGNIETVIYFLNKMNIHNYNKPVYYTTTRNTKIYTCDIHDPKNILLKEKYKWLNEREILKLDNSNAILKSFFKKFKRNIKNKKNMNSYDDDYNSYNSYNENYIELKIHDYESIRSMIEKRKDIKDQHHDCDEETVKSVLDFLDLDEYDDLFNKECDCETVKSVLDFLEMDKIEMEKPDYDYETYETVKSVLDFLEM